MRNCPISCVASLSEGLRVRLERLMGIFGSSNKPLSVEILSGDTSGPLLDPEIGGTFLHISISLSLSDISELKCLLGDDDAKYISENYT